MISREDIANETGIVAIDIGSDGASRGRERAPQPYPSLHGPAARVTESLESLSGALEIRPADS